LMRLLDCCPAHRTNEMHSFLDCFLWYVRVIGLLWFSLISSSNDTIDQNHPLIHSPSLQYQTNEMHSIIDCFMWYFILWALNNFEIPWPMIFQWEIFTEADAEIDVHGSIYV
jgi:hypothetical protein